MNQPAIPGQLEPTVIHRDHRIEYANESFCSLVGCDGAGAITGDSVLQFIATEYHDPLVAQFQRIAPGEVPALGLTVEVETLSGRTRDVVALSSPIEWDGEHHLQTVFIDTEGRLPAGLPASTMNETPVGISIADATRDDEPLIYVNDGFVELTGYPREEILGRNCRFLQGEETNEETVAEVGAAIDAEEPITVELRNYRKDGTMFWNRLSITPIENEEGEVTHFLGFQEDISERKRYEQEKSLFEMQAESIDQAIFITDIKGVIQYVNPQFERTTGYTASEAIGETPRILKSDQQDPKFYEELWETITSGEIWEAEITNRRKSGERYRTRQKIVPVTDTDETITHFVCIEEDITDAQFIDQVLDVMSRVLRHNVRNAVTAIDGYADVIETALDESEHEAAVQSIREQARKLQKLSDETRAIRELFRRRNTQHTLAVEAIRGFVEQRQQTHPDADISISMEVASNVEIRNGSLLQLAIDEAIENAVVHSDRERPRVTVTVSQTERGDEVRIDIADDGPGIPDDQWNVIETGKETPLAHSVGIGLWLMHWTVTALGGSIERSENDPRGSVVTYRVPARTSTEDYQGNT